MHLTKDPSGFSAVAIRLGEMMTNVPFDRDLRVTTAQWLIPRYNGLPFETAPHVGEPDAYYLPTVRAMAQACAEHGPALALIMKWSVIVDGEGGDPLRYLLRWLTPAPSPAP